MILDATCGGRMMWFDKENVNTIYVDQRTIEKGTHPTTPGFSILPDVVASFTDMPIDDESADLIVFDPPHVSRPTDAMLTSNVGMMYGKLPAEWRPVIASGFDECWRTLRPGGTLIFKWTDDSIALKDVLGVLPDHIQPLFGTRIAPKGSTVWLVFNKQRDGTWMTPKADQSLGPTDDLEG